MSWPHREGMTVHTAAEAAGDGTQRCSRCGKLLHDNRSGAPAPWAPGMLVAVSSTGQVRMRVKAAEPYAECEPADGP